MRPYDPRSERGREDERRTAARERAGRLHADLRAVAGTPEGRRILRWLVDQGRLFEDEFFPDGAMAYNAGARAAARRLWNRLREALAPEIFFKTVLEREDA